jgi:site-specific recombinase XerD
MEAKSQCINTLIAECEQEFIDMGYGVYRHRKICKYWEEFAQWMKNSGLEFFTKEVGRQYCIETFGTDIMPPDIEKCDQLRLRAIRMLISFHCDGCFEFRTPSAAPRVFRGETGELMESFIQAGHEEQSFSEDTIREKRLRLYEFCEYLEEHDTPLSEINIHTLTEFMAAHNYSLSKRRYFSSTIKQFLRYAYDVGANAIDLSHIVMPVSKGPEKLPTTYTEDEIRRMLTAIERGSAIGKRDYLVVLLAAEYGWRASDIAGFQFSWIDWDKNTISFDQHKTGVPVQYPLLASIGNAVIDYLKDGRPKTETPEIIVGHDTIKRGKKLHIATLHSIVKRYIRTADIDNWKQKKHGPHALRFSLATNLLKKNTSLPVIATILGHQSTESTKRYISLDIDQLRKCALPIPSLNTAIFEVVI